MTPGEYTVACDTKGQWWVVRLDPGEQVHGPIDTVNEAWSQAARLNIPNNKEHLQ